MKVVLHYNKRTGDWYTNWKDHRYDIEHGVIGYNITRDDDEFQWRFAETLKQVRESIADE